MGSLSSKEDGSQEHRSWWRWRNVRWLAVAPAVVAVWACTSHPLEAPTPSPETETNAIYEAAPNRQLDLLFMVDNSSSMAPKQQNLSKNFGPLVQELQKIAGGLPDIRIAVISSDFGAGVTTIDTCHPLGDVGKFQVKAGCGLDPTVAHYLAVDSKGVQNFTGNLPDVFACMALLGDRGCGYEHQLQSVRAALSTVNAENQGFLRPQAYLGVVLITDEDDCSADPQSLLFQDDIAGQAPSFRCTKAGHDCQGMDVPASEFTAPLSSCKPHVRTDDMDGLQHRLINVSDFVSFVKGLKPNLPDHILVSAITGWSDAADAQYHIGSYPNPQVPGSNQIDLGPICNSSVGSATPALRIKSFLDGFGTDGHWYTICSDDFSPAMRDIGMKLAAKLDNACITSPLIDTDLNTAGVQPDCEVIDQTPNANGSGYTDNPLPGCAGGGAPPCWSLEADAGCGSGYRVKVTRTDPPAVGVLENIRCLTCTGAAANDPRCVAAP